MQPTAVAAVQPDRRTEPVPANFPGSVSYCGGDRRVPMSKCAYVVSVIALYWIAEPIPQGATSLSPIVLLPMLGILSTERTCQLYMNGTNFMFLGTLVMAIAVEHSKLHQRIALKILCLLGTGVKTLVFGLMFISMFLSMWINNVAVAAMMVPVVDSIARELLGTARRYSLKEHNILEPFDEKEYTELKEQLALENESSDVHVYTNGHVASSEIIQIKLKNPTARQPSQKPVSERVRVLLYLSVIYGANTGAITTITSAGSNFVFKFVIEDVYKGRAPVDYASWLFFALPITLISTLTIYCAMITIFFCCRRSKLDNSGGEATRQLIQRNYVALGRITFHEVGVLLLFLLLVFLWLFRDPSFARGWAALLDPM